MVYSDIVEIVAAIFSIVFL